MGRILRTPQAVDDVIEIWRYIAVDQGNPVAADKLVERFESILRRIADQPAMGTECDEYSPGLRFFVVKNYVLFYRPLTDGVRLIRVLHGARRFEGLF